jgi:hypothetical protein
VVSFCWCSFAALPKRLPPLFGVAAEEAPHPIPFLRHLQVLPLGVATAAAAATAGAAAGGLSMRPSRVAKLFQAEAPRRSPKVFMWPLLINPRYNAIKTSGFLGLVSLMAGS